MYHSCFINSAWLCALLGRIPIPPSFFGLQTCSHGTRWIFFFPLFPPHRKDRLALSMDSSVEDGRRLVCIVWLGILLNTDLMGVAQPAKDKHEAFQLESLFWTFLVTPAKVPLLTLSLSKGTPKYLPRQEVKGIPHCWLSERAIVLLTFLDTHNLDFWRLIRLTRDLTKILKTWRHDLYLARWRLAKKH